MFWTLRRDYKLHCATSYLWWIIAPNAFLIFVFASDTQLLLKVAAAFFVIFIEKIPGRVGLSYLAIETESRQNIFSQQIYIRSFLVKALNGEYEKGHIPEFDSKIAKTVSIEMTKIKKDELDKFDSLIKNDLIYYIIRSSYGFFLLVFRFSICIIASVVISNFSR